MNAAQIVRALAAKEPPMDTGYGYCLYCDEFERHGVSNDDIHKPACPWRQAREWVAANGWQ